MPLISNNNSSFSTPGRMCLSADGQDTKAKAGGQYDITYRDGKHNNNNNINNNNNGNNNNNEVANFKILFSSSPTVGFEL